MSVPWSTDSTSKSDWTLHQIAPYIGRMKTSMAKHFVERYTKPGDLVADPFCGCGVVPVEAAYRGRRVFASDWNPYGVLLTEAKLSPPARLPAALENLHDVLRASRRHHAHQDLRKVPAWVRKFFHPRTLKETLAVRDACVANNQTFVLACLLGILHHQRPGFLSYPSSHLVPYLRSKKFPRAEFPEMYDYRDIAPRLEAKIVRTYRRLPDCSASKSLIRLRDASKISVRREISAVITSPPYMNELDYVRDNRLRLWFLSKELPSEREISARNREEDFSNLVASVTSRLGRRLRNGGHFVYVVGDVSRGRRKSDPAKIVRDIVLDETVCPGLRIVDEYDDLVPDIRRSRREVRGTKRETIIVARKAA